MPIRGIKVDIRRYRGDDDLKAFADVTIRVKFGEITIQGFKILQGEKKPFVAFPQIQYTQFLQTKYKNILHMNKRVEDFIRNQIIKAYRSAIKSKDDK